MYIMRFSYKIICHTMHNIKAVLAMEYTKHFVVCVIKQILTSGSTVGL